MTTTTASVAQHAIILTSNWWQYFAASALTSQGSDYAYLKTYASDGSFFYFKVNIHLSKIIGVFAEIISVCFLYFPSWPRSYFCSHLFCQPFILWLLSFYGNVAVTGSKKPHLLASQKTGCETLTIETGHFGCFRINTVSTWAVLFIFFTIVAPKLVCLNLCFVVN